MATRIQPLSRTSATTGALAMASLYTVVPVGPRSRLSAESVETSAARHGQPPTLTRYARVRVSPMRRPGANALPICASGEQPTRNGYAPISARTGSGRDPAHKMPKTGASKRETMRRALCVLSDDMLIDLVAFCRTHAEYKQSDLHEMAQDVLRSSCIIYHQTPSPVSSGIATARGR